MPEQNAAPKLCKDCGQPMLPPGVVKLPNEYDHAQGCPSDNAAPILSREEIGELKMFITAHRALAGTRVNDILYSHEAQREEIQCLTESRDAISALFPDDAPHKHAETGVSLLDDVRDLIAGRKRIAEERDAAQAKLRLEWSKDAVISERNSELSDLRVELEAVKAAEGELEVWLCPVHKSLDDSRKLQPLGNCMACIRAERNELPVRLEEAERDQDVLKLIERITGDDFCEDLDCRDGISHELTGDLKTAADKLSAIYRHAHSALRGSTCHAAHDDWRREADAAISATTAEPEATVAKSATVPTPAEPSGNTTLEADNRRLREALTDIAKTPGKPFPDAGAHSLRAFSDAVFRAWSRCNQRAHAALQPASPQPSGNTGELPVCATCRDTKRVPFVYGQEYDCAMSTTVPCPDCSAAQPTTEQPLTFCTRGAGHDGPCNGLEAEECIIARVRRERAEQPRIWADHGDVAGIHHSDDNGETWIDEQAEREGK